MAHKIPQDAAIAALAARQHGNVTRGQLLALGLTNSAIIYRVRAGRLYRVYTGVYAVGHPPQTPLERAAAAVLACGPGAALSYGSAMTMWGFWRRWDVPFEVSVLVDRRPKGIHVHRPTGLQRRDLVVHQGIRVTSPARTLLDMAPRLPEAKLRRGVNDALHSFLTESQLAELLARTPTHPGARLLAPFAGNRHGLSRSALEDAFLRFCERYGFPRPLTNAHVGGYLVDAYFEPHKLIVELDSWQFHSSRIDFEKDRDRDADHLSDGIATIRLTHERMEREPDAEAARLHRILLRLSEPRVSRRRARFGRPSARRGSMAMPGAPGARRRARCRPAR